MVFSGDFKVALCFKYGYIWLLLGVMPNKTVLYGLSYQCLVINLKFVNHLVF